MGKGKTKRAKASLQVKLVKKNDPRVAPPGGIVKKKGKGKGGAGVVGGRSGRAAADLRNIPNVSSGMYFAYNASLGPPYRVLIDTNFINFSVANKLDVIEAAMRCLYAKVIPCITDCVMAELEKMGVKYRVALRLAKDPRFERLPCLHKGTYADDCLVARATMHKCYIVATCDKDLKRRIRKIPGVPIMYIKARKYSIERMPDALGAPRDA